MRCVTYSNSRLSPRWPKKIERGVVDDPARVLAELDRLSDEKASLLLISEEAKSE